MIILSTFVLMLLTYVVTFESTMVMPLAPVIANTYGIAPANVTLLNLGFALSGLCSPFFGYLADYFSMKKIMQLSMIIFMAGSLLVYSTSTTGYIVGRLILGIGLYNIQSIAMSYSSIMVDESKLGIVAGLFKIAFALGAFSAPILGGWISITYSFKTIYLMLAGFALIGTILLAFIPDVKIAQDEPLKAGQAFALLKDKKAQLMIAAMFFLTIPSVFFYNFLSIDLSAKGVSQASISSYYSVVATGAITAGVLITLFSDRFGKRRMSVLSTSLGGIMLLPFLSGRPPLLIIGFLFGLCYDTIWGLFFPAGATFYRRKSATFLTILSLMSSVTNFFTNSTAPFFFEIGRFPLLIAIGSLGLLFSAFLMKRAFQLDNEEQGVTQLNN